MRRTLVTSLLLAALALPASAQMGLRTHHEDSGFTEYTPYTSMMEYLHDVRALSSEMALTSYGETYQGRELPLAIFSRPRITQPWEAWALDRPVLSFNASVHGDERTTREALLMFIRELATAGTEANALLDEVVILVAPQINPDGFEAPGGAQRGNSWDIDMNRDWVKLEQDALTAYATNVIGKWRPHLFIDGHNGGRLPYDLTYQCPSHAEPDPRITALCDDEIFPYIDAQLESRGMDTWYYSTRGVSTEQWTSGGFDARIGRNYGGFINTVAILFESPPDLPMERAALAAKYGYHAVAEWAGDNAGTLMETVRRARIETIEMGMAAEGEVVTDQEYGPDDELVSYRYLDDDDPDAQEIAVTGAQHVKKPIVTASRPRPWAYVLPRDAEGAVALLRRHGITVEQLYAPVTLTVDAYVLQGVEREQAYNHDAAARVTLGETVTRQMEFPQGSYIVQTGQMLGRLVGHMLEPETNDNVVYWNTMDAWLPESSIGSDEAPLVPIYKLMEATPLPAKLIR